MEVRELAVSGMSCGHCVAAVKDALGSLPGVEVRDVSIGKATVAFDSGEVSDSELVDAVDEAGYTAVVSR